MLTNAYMLESIFNDGPSQWGLRGDPSFWDYLSRKYGKILINNITEEELVNIIYQEYESLTGEKLTTEARGYTKSMNTNGMSGSNLSGKWWITEGIPLLCNNLTRSRQILNQSEDSSRNSIVKKEAKPGTIRDNIKPGVKVKIVLKKDQPTGILTEGVVARILTNSGQHHRGIKVMLEDGQVGRVQEIV